VCVCVCVFLWVWVFGAHFSCLISPYSSSVLGVCEVPLAYLQTHFTYLIELCTANLSAFDTPLAPIRLFADVTLKASILAHAVTLPCTHAHMHRYPSGAH
jgi:hypothetical protein